ncbi:MAG: hypothetical protein J7L61_03540 [Thermoplasmata archaeon]|nr:hypothetical protein [Thermoplasmata archaeon]
MRAVLLYMALAAALTFSVVFLSPWPPASGADGPQAFHTTPPVVYSRIVPEGGNWTFTEGDMIRVQIDYFTLEEANGSLAAYSRGQMLWSSGPMHFTPGQGNITASFPAVYGMYEVVFTGSADNTPVPPLSFYVEINPGVVISYLGPVPEHPREGESVSFHFRLYNNLSSPLENFSLTLYKINSYGGRVGMRDLDMNATVLSRKENLSLAPGGSMDINMTWDTAVWGTYSMQLVLSREGGSLPYQVAEYFQMSVEDLEESPMPPLEALAASLAYFPLVVLVFWLLSALHGLARKPGSVPPEKYGGRGEGRKTPMEDGRGPEGPGGEG